MFAGVHGLMKQVKGPSYTLVMSPGQTSAGPTEGAVIYRGELGLSGVVICSDLCRQI